MFFNSGVVHLKRSPKNSRIPLAESLIPKINDICEILSKIDLWLSSQSSKLYKGNTNPEELNVRPHLNKRILNGVIEKKPQEKSMLDRDDVPFAII